MKYSKQNVDELCKYISNGLSQKDASIMVGIGETTFYEWLKKAEVSEAIKKATVRFKLFHIHNIAKHAETTFTASAWLLERKFRDEFGSVNEKALLDRLAALEQKINGQQT